MKTIDPNENRFNIASAFAVLEEPANEKALLVTEVRRLKLAGYGTAGRWSLATLRQKLGRTPAAEAPTADEAVPALPAKARRGTRQPAAFRKADFRGKGTDLVTAAAVSAEGAHTASPDAPAPADGTPEVPVANPVAAPENADTLPVTPAAETAAPDTTAAAPAAATAKPAGKKLIAKGDRFTGKVTEKLAIGVLVQLPVRNCSAFMHVSELSGGGFNARNRRLETIAIGEEIPVEIVRASKPGERRNFRASEKRVSNERLLTELTEGTTVEVVVIALKEFGVLVTMQDGPAKGCDALIHVSEFPGKREARDATMHKTQLGAVLHAEVLSIKRNEKRTDDLDVRCTLRGPENRKFLEGFSEGSVRTGKVVAHADGAFTIRFGSVKGFLTEDKLGRASVDSLHIGEPVRVRVESFNQARMTCVVTRRGL